MLFTLNTLLVLLIFKFLFKVFGHDNKVLDQKDRLISKFMMPQPG